MIFAKAKEMDLTKGNLFRKIFSFSMPLMITSILQLLYTTVDLWTVSNFGGGSISMSAIGSNGALINLIISSLIFISLGSGVTISIAKGSNNKEKASRILHTSFIIAFVGGIVVGIFGYFFAPLILKAMDTPISLLDKATLYLQIYFLGIPFLAMVNFGTKMLSSLGDSTRPMIFLTISGLINVGFDLVCVIFLNLDVAGVAIATIISWVFACLFIIMWFAKSDSVFVNFSIKELRVSKEELKEILKIGIPAGIQGVAFSFPNLLIQSSLYTIVNYQINNTLISTEEIVSGASACAQIEGYVFAALDCFSVANIAFTGQNFGAKKKNNMVKSYWFCLLWMVITWIVCCIICFTFSEQIFSIFITENKASTIIKENAIMAGNQRLVLMVSTYILDSWMNLNSSYLKGMKKSLVPAIMTLIGCTGFRILFLLTLFKMPFFHTVTWLYATFPISWALLNLAYLPIILIIQKKQFKLIEN